MGWLKGGLAGWLYCPDFEGCDGDGVAVLGAE
jgi:hypothetical protein